MLVSFIFCFTFSAFFCFCFCLRKRKVGPVVKASLLPSYVQAAGSPAQQRSRGHHWRKAERGERHKETRTKKGDSKTIIPATRVQFFSWVPTTMDGLWVMKKKTPTEPNFYAATTNPTSSPLSVACPSFLPPSLLLATTLLPSHSDSTGTKLMRSQDRRTGGGKHNTRQRDDRRKVWRGLLMQGNVSVYSRAPYSGCEGSVSSQPPLNVLHQWGNWGIVSLPARPRILSLDIISPPSSFWLQFKKDENVFHCNTLYSIKMKEISHAATFISWENRALKS